MILAAVIIAVGVFQPWVYMGGAGVDSNLGLLVLISSVFIAIFALKFLVDSDMGKDVCAIVTVIGLAVVLVSVRLIWDVLDVSDSEDIGSGLYLMLIGGAMSATCSITTLIRTLGQRSVAES